MTTRSMSRSRTACATAPTWSTAPARSRSRRTGLSPSSDRMLIVRTSWRRRELIARSATGGTTRSGRGMADGRSSGEDTATVPRRTATDRSTVARCVVQWPAARPCARPRGLCTGRVGLGAVRQAEPDANRLDGDGLVVAPLDQADAGAPACVALALVEFAAGGEAGLAAPVRQPEVMLLAPGTRSRPRATG